MIDIETLFILGAGASRPYNYPTGKELRRLIYENFTEDYKAIATKEKSNNTYIDSEIDDEIESAPEFVDKFFKSSTPSIDLFLSRNPSFSNIGKKAIALNILKAERASFFREKVDQNQDWYSYLYHRMTENMTKPDGYKQVGQNKISIITFNYDRSLEFFLYESLTNSFEESSRLGQFYDTLLPFPIQHVYGKIAPLPYQKEPVFSIYHAADPNFTNLQNTYNNIRVIYERTDENLKGIREQISNAKRIFFLGFGFAKENLEALDIPNLLTGEHEIYGTALGMTAKEIFEVRSLLNQNFKIKNPALTNPIIKNMNCYEILREYL